MDRSRQKCGLALLAAARGAAGECAGGSRNNYSKTTGYAAQDGTADPVLEAWQEEALGEAAPRPRTAGQAPTGESEDGDQAELVS